MTHFLKYIQNNKLFTSSFRLIYLANFYVTVFGEAPIQFFMDAVLAVSKYKFYIPQGYEGLLLRILNNCTR